MWIFLWVMLNRQSQIFNITGHLPNISRYLMDFYLIIAITILNSKSISKTQCHHDTIFLKVQSISKEENIQCFKICKKYHSFLCVCLLLWWCTIILKGSHFITKVRRMYFMENRHYKNKQKVLERYLYTCFQADLRMLYINLLNSSMLQRCLPIVIM